MATDFIATFGYIHSFSRAAFKNGLQYRHSKIKIFNGNILAHSVKYDENRSSNPLDYDGNKCTFLEETAKIGLFHRISHQLLDRSSPYIWRLQNLHKFCGSLWDVAIVTN